MLWWVEPSTRPADLGSDLERRGSTHAGNSPAMALDLRTLPEEPPSIPILVVVATVEDLVHLQDRFRVARYSKVHENSNLCTFVLRRGA